MNKAAVRSSPRLKERYSRLQTAMHTPSTLGHNDSLSDALSEETVNDQNTNSKISLATHPALIIYYFIVYLFDLLSFAISEIIKHRLKTILVIIFTAGFIFAELLIFNSIISEAGKSQKILTTFY